MHTYSEQSARNRMIASIVADARQNLGSGEWRNLAVLPSWGVSPLDRWLCVPRFRGVCLFTDQLPLNYTWITGIGYWTKVQLPTKKQNNDY